MNVRVKVCWFRASMHHKAQVCVCVCVCVRVCDSIWFCHAEEVTQLLRSAGYREGRRERVVVMALS